MFFLFLCLLLPSSSLLALNFKSVFSLQRISVENLPWRGFGATCCACVSFAWKIVRDLPMVNIVSQTMNKHKQPFMNNTWCALVIDSKVFVAWKRQMLHDVSGGQQAYIRRKIYVWGIEFCSQQKTENQHMLNAHQPISWRMTSTKVSNSGFFSTPYVAAHLTVVGEGGWVIYLGKNFFPKLVKSKFFSLTYNVVRFFSALYTSWGQFFPLQDIISPWYIRPSFFPSKSVYRIFFLKHS